jgi:hypothetical protein
MYLQCRSLSLRDSLSSGLPCNRRVTRISLVAGTLSAFLAVPLAASAQNQASPEFRTAPRSLITEKVDRARMVPAQGALNPIVARYRDLGEVSPTLPIRHIQLLLQRPPERQLAFDAQVEALHTVGSSSYHKWLTPEVVGSEFGPSQSDLTTISSFLTAEGFTLDHVGKGGLYIDFSGTAAQVEHTFQTTIHAFQVPGADGVRFAAVQPASIPEALAPAVVGIVALSNIMSAHTTHHLVGEREQPVALPVGIAAVDAKPEDTLSATHHAVGPQDFYTIYNENALLNAATPVNGTGVTIALLEQSAINTADVTTFRSTFGVVPNTPVSLVVDTGYGSNTCTAPAMLAGTEEDEAVLATEWAGAVAPGANLIFMQCAGEGIPLGVLYSAEAVIDNNLADIMSLTYSQYEGYSNTEDSLAVDLWEQAASQGETVVVSAGDTGPASEDGVNGTTYVASGITANTFSTTSWNVSAGGTDFLDTYNGDEGDSAFGIGRYWSNTNGTGLGSALSYIPEMTWNDSCGSSIYANYLSTTPENLCGLSGETYPGHPNESLFAGGGAPSTSSTKVLTTLRPRPSWQKGTVYGLPAVSGTNAERLQPDLSLFASNGWWGHDLPAYESDLATPTFYAGGTAFVASQLAGVFALVQQATGERQGQPNFVLYNMAGNEYGTSTPLTNSCNGSGTSGTGTTSSSPSAGCIFYDVQSGSTQLPCVTGDPGCYTAAGLGYTHGVLSTSTSADIPASATTTGWDDATGIGSINIANLVNNWQGTTSSILYTPVIAVTATVSTITYGTNPSIIYTATVSGPGSYPTGSVAITGSGSIGAIGTSTPLKPTTTSSCSNGLTCVETVQQIYHTTGTLGAGSYIISATYSPVNENYAAGVTGTTPLTVTKQTPTLTVSNVMANYGDTSANLTANLTFSGYGVLPTGGLTFTLTGQAPVTATCTTSANPIVCSYTYPLAALSSGTYTITAKYAGDSNYKAVTATGTLTYGNGSGLAFSVASPQHTMYPVIALTSTSNGTGAITYTVVSGPATISGSTATLTGAGSVTIQASQAADSTYTPTFVNSTFTVLAGSVWVADSTSDLSTFDLLGGVITASPGLSGAGLSTIAGPQGEAFDASGNLWVAAANGVSTFSGINPSATASTPSTDGGVTNPLALAVDGASSVWVANGNGTLSVLRTSGAVTPSTGYVVSGLTSTTGGITIDLSGNVWVTNNSDNSVTEVIGAASAVAPPSTGLQNGTTGSEP